MFAFLILWFGLQNGIGPV